MTDLPMKLWRIPNPWDYHKQGAIMVMAVSKEEAIAKAKSHPQIKKYFKSDIILWDDIKEAKGGITYDGGCDC